MWQTDLKVVELESKVEDLSKLLEGGLLRFKVLLRRHLVGTEQ